MAQQNMGLGDLGTGKTVFKRKFRWTMEFRGICGDDELNIPPSYVKAANRPTLAIEEVAINYLHGIMYIPGKGTPDTTVVTYYDVASSAGSQSVSRLFTWLSTVYNFNDPIKLTMSSATNVFGSYTAKAGILRMLDGCGSVIDGFLYLAPWPTNIAFGELDYGTNDECTIDVTLRYRNFQYFTSDQECSNQFDVYCAGCGAGAYIYGGAQKLGKTARQSGVVLKNGL